MRDSPKPRLKLAVIIFTDIFGFTELMIQNKNSVMQLLDFHRKLLKPIVENYKGKWLKEIGD
tara:strand:- start:649 stop:834 length:186 start_codon:yes stop_codon:yes gene_type:complete